MSVVRTFVVDGGGAVVALAAPELLASAAVVQAHARRVAAATAHDSQKLVEQWGTTVGGQPVASRPFDFTRVAFALSVNTYHAAACEQKALDVAGRAWRVVGDASAAKRVQAEKWLRGAFGDLPFGEGLKRIWTEYEALGNAFVEVIPDGSGKPAQLRHLPACEMWVRLDSTGFVQLLNGNTATFRRWGLRGAAPTSVIHWSRYSPLSSWYGLPCVLPAWNSVVLLAQVGEFNTQFFTNHCIPAYVVVVKGDVEGDLEDKVRQYFREHIKGQHNKTMLFTLPEGGEIKFERLTSDQAKEGSFRLLRVDSRDEILQAHRVPPHIVGVVQQGQLGGSVAFDQMRQYKQAVVDPGREQLLEPINRVLVAAGFEGCKLEFEPFDVVDREVEARIDAVYLDRDVLLRNEVRRRMGMEDVAWGDEQMRPAFADAAGLSDQLADVQQAIAAAAA